MRHDAATLRAVLGGEPGSTLPAHPAPNARADYVSSDSASARLSRVWAALNSTRTTPPMMIRSRIIWTLTTMRAGSVLGVMSPNPTVENTVIVSYMARVWSRFWVKVAADAWDIDR